MLGRTSLISTLLISAALLDGCNCGGESIAHLVPKGAFNPAMIDFGDVTVGATAKQSSVLKNIGAIPFTIKSVDNGGGSFQLQYNGGSPMGVMFPVDGTQAFDVLFSPGSPGPKTGLITVHLDSDVRVTLQVKGNGVTHPVPNLALNPMAIDFGTVVLGQSAHAMVTVMNSGTGPGTIMAVNLSSTNRPPAMSDPFALATPLAVTVNQGMPQMLDLVFTPQTAGPATDTMVFTGNLGPPQLTLTVKGNGMAPAGYLQCNPNTLSFGTVLPGMMTSKMVTCTAHGGSIMYSGTTLSADPTFQLAMVPTATMLSDGQPITFEVQFNPSGMMHNVSGMVMVDYSSSTGNASVTIPLTAQVGMQPVGMLTCTPNPVQFGTVLPGMSSTKQVTCTSHGGTITFTTAALAGDPMYQLSSVPSMITLNDGQSAMFNVSFNAQGMMASPTSVCTVSYTTSAGNATAMIPINGQVGMAPAGSLTCMPTSIDYGTVARGMTVSRQVTCTANSGSISFMGAATSGDPAFTVSMVPAAMMLASGQSLTFNVNFNPQGNIMMTDNGTCTVSYTGMAAATIMIPLTGVVMEPPPTTQAIAGILTGDDTQVDVDLHLVRPGGSPFDSLMNTDCFYVNCAPFFYNMSWPSPMPGDMSYNPHLDHDPVMSVGTEEINVQNAEAGSYDFYVHYYGAVSPSPSHAVSVQVFVGGMMVGTYNNTLTCKQFWHVGTVNWTGTSGTFTPDTAITTRTEGSCM